MCVFRRSYISIKRNYVKTLILFIIIFLLSILMSVAISMSHAITNTENALKRQLPAIATIRIDHEAFLLKESTEEIERDRVTPTLLREIGQLPYVRMFDYVLSRNLFSEELVRTFDVSLFDILNYDIAPQIDHMSLAAHGVDWIESFDLRGVYHPKILDIEAGLIDLTAGRVFTTEEAEIGAPVAIVSQSWLDANELNLGDTFTLQDRIHLPPSNTFDFDFTSFLSDENLLTSSHVDFEIIGVFDKTLDLYLDGESFDSDALFTIQEHLNFLNRIYVPVRFNESLATKYDDFWGDNLPEGIVLVDSESEHNYHSMIFFLYDPLELVAFEKSVTPLLPDFSRVDIASNSHSDIYSAMEVMRELSTNLVIGALLTTTGVFSLIIFLFLSDRRSEIGLYLSLGERKNRIFFQIFFEILLIAPIAITLGLSFGSLLSDNLSPYMMRQELVSQAEQVRTDTIWNDSPTNLGFRHEMTHEELLDAFDTSLDIYTIVIFYSISFSIIVFSTAFSILYVLKQSPKYNLMKGFIG